MIKFNLHNIVDTETKEKDRVFYSLDNRTDNKLCVTIYARDYDNNLSSKFPEQYVNETDYYTDYFEKGRVTIFEDHPQWAEYRKQAETVDAKLKASREKRRATQLAKWEAKRA